ncbi:hypothetical protein BD770DRAFT_430279 [Pilaira anomala]|nr:hypothetical protein BD770DRAFT_430279 [Pilaira anomala]
MSTHNLLNIAEILTERLINLIEKESENEDDYSLDLVAITEPMPCTIIARDDRALLYSRFEQGLRLNRTLLVLLLLLTDKSALRKSYTQNRLCLHHLTEKLSHPKNCPACVEFRSECHLIWRSVYI